MKTFLIVICILIIACLSLNCNEESFDEHDLKNSGHNNENIKTLYY